MPSDPVTRWDAYNAKSKVLDVTGVRLLASAALLLVLESGGAAAEDYPSHPIKLLVGFSPGGGLDISCRHWAQRLSARLGQQVVVENRPGASGELAVKQAMASKRWLHACLPIRQQHDLVEQTEPAVRHP